MSEQQQLWYTWSTSGFGIANDYRVRAASANLMDVEGQRVRSFIGLLRYKLSQDVDPFLPPLEAPVCLAFLKAVYKKEDKPVQESVLIQKTYTGLDGIRRPGAYFSHLITDLPPVFSASPAGHVPFSAREASNMWRSPLWKDSESSLPARERDLDSISSTNLLAGPLTEQSVTRMQELFTLALQAFLTLALSGERKRLYLGGDPDTVATLIWGITHALPRTLGIMRELTFSTYEADLESETKPLIIGTCWLPTHLKQGYENALLDFPPQYYQSDNAYGIAIHCTDPQKKHTPFTPQALVTRYTQFVLDCFARGPVGVDELNSSVLDEAEKRSDIQDTLAFLNLYSDLQEMLTKEDVTRLLQEMIEKVEALNRRGEAILAQEKLDVLEMLPLQNITLQGDILQRDNFRRSLIHWMTHDGDWWQSQGHPRVSRMYRLTYQYSVETLTEKRMAFVQRVTGKSAWRKRDGTDQIGGLMQYVQVQAATAPIDILTAFANMVTTTMQEAQNEVVLAMLPFTKKVIEYVCRSIQRDDSAAARSWTVILTICTERITTMVHSYLLEQLCGLGYTAAYKQWWQEYGLTMIPRLALLVHRRAAGELSQTFTRFATYVAQELVAAIQTNQPNQLTFWNGMLDKATSSSLATEPEAWATVLTGLAATPYTEAFKQWWKDSGKSAASSISALASEQADPGLQEALTTFAHKPVQEIQTSLKKNEVVLLPFWEEVLASVASYQTRPVIWLDLLNGLTAETLTPTFQRWWSDQGREATRYVCQLIERTAQGPAYLTLTAFLRAVDEALYRYIMGEVQEGQQRYEAMTAFCLEVLLDSVPAQQADIWLKQIQKLNDKFVYRDARWSLRALLLERWNKAPLLRNGTQSQLLLWLEPIWGDLDAFLSLTIVDDWKKIAITKALETYNSIPNQVVVEVVKQQNWLFSMVLQDLIKVSQTQPVVFKFFGFLAQQHYAYLFDLLNDLLATCNYQPDITEQLLNMIVPASHEEVVRLLEQYCLDLLKRADLSQSMLRLLTAYFQAFDVASLDSRPTQDLLGVLYQRVKSLPADLQPSVTGWYAIAEFLAQPQSSPNALRDLSHRLRNMVQLVPDMQQKLTAKLTPHLVDLVSTEADLTRVLDNVGRDRKLDLLLEMVRIVGEKYGQQRPPRRLAPYVSVVLQESNWVQSSQKERFIDTCLQLLFIQVDAKTRDGCWPESMWADRLRNEWKSYQERLRSAEREKVAPLKRAIKNGVVPEMISAYDPVLDSFLNTQEMTVINLALQSLEAYHADDMVGMVEAHRALAQYVQQPSYAPEQANRIEQAFAYMQEQRRQAAFQEQQRRAALQQQEQAASMSNGVPPVGQANASDSAEGRGNKAGTSIAQRQGIESSQSPAQPLQRSQSGAGENQKAVATVNSRSISEEWLQLAINIERMYLSHRQLQLQAHIQKVERGVVQEDKKTLASRRKDEKEIGKLINDVMRLREVTLDELIDDVLIQEEIGKLRASSNVQWRSLEQGMESKIASLHAELATVPGSSDSKLSSREPKDVEEVRAALAVLVRRDLFERYLRQVGASTTEDWLKMQRGFANITNNDAYASKRKGLKFLGR